MNTMYVLYQRRVKNEITLKKWSGTWPTRTSNLTISPIMTSSLAQNYLSRLLPSKLFKYLNMLLMLRYSPSISPPIHFKWIARQVAMHCQLIILHALVLSKEKLTATITGKKKLHSQATGVHGERKADHKHLSPRIFSKRGIKDIAKKK